MIALGARLLAQLKVRLSTCVVSTNGCIPAGRPPANGCVASVMFRLKWAATVPLFAAMPYCTHASLRATIVGTARFLNVFPIAATLPAWDDTKINDIPSAPRRVAAL